MLLHYAIRIVEKNQPKNNSSDLINLDFSFVSSQSEKIEYIVFGNQCQHILDKFIDLKDVVNGFNSKNRSYQCPYCDVIYNEISDFHPHDLQLKIKKEFHNKFEKISVLHGNLISHLKRNKKRFGEPLIAGRIKNEIKELFIEKPDDPIQQKCQLDNIFLNTREESFQSLCLLDNVIITIPVRHKDCNHIDAYELTSLITYQIENYQKLPDIMKNRDTNKYLQCKVKECKAKFPLEDDKLLLKSLVLDFEYLKLIKKSYPGNQIYKAEQIGNQLTFNELTKNTGKDDFIYKYWQGFCEDLEQIDYFSFQKAVLERMIMVMNNDLHKKVKVDINNYKYCRRKIIYKTGIPKKDNKQIEFDVEYPARCFNCDIEKYDEKKQDQKIENIDLRILICMIYHQQLKAKKQNDATSKFICPLCKKESKKSFSQLQFNNETLYYDQNLHQKVKSDIRDAHQQKFFYLDGKAYLLESLKNVLKYTLQNYVQDYVEQTQLEIQFDENGVPVITVNFQSNKCVYFKLNITEPLLNFKCKNQGRIKFEAFYTVFRDNGFSFGKGLKLCKCENSDCGVVTEIEGQLYFDQVYDEAIKNKQPHQDLDNGFSYNFSTQKLIENKSNQKFIKINLNPPVVRVHIDEDQEYSKNPFLSGVSFKNSKQDLIQQ